MARIRTIKPEFPQSESMGRVSRDARLLFVQLWTVVDDAGRARGNSRILASLLYPYDDDALDLIDGWLFELEREGCVARYAHEGSTYIQILRWKEHQKIDKPSKSRLPQFDESSRILSTPREGARLIREASSGDLDLGRDLGRDQEGSTQTRAREPAIEPDDGAEGGRVGRDPPTHRAAIAREPTDDPADLEAWQRVRAAYPRCLSPGPDWIAAERDARQRIADGDATWAELEAGAARYAVQCAARGAGTRYVKSPKAFFTIPGRMWAEEFPLPESADPTPVRTWEPPDEPEEGASAQA